MIFKCYAATTVYTSDIVYLYYILACYILLWIMSDSRRLCAGAERSPERPTNFLQCRFALIMELAQPFFKMLSEILALFETCRDSVLV